MAIVNLRRVLLVALGGTIGTAVRLGLGLAVPDPGGFPVAILVANVVGSFLIGIVAARLAASAELRVFLGTGVLGGFTTYSAFMTGTLALWASAPLVAAGYAVMSLALGVVAAALGLRLGRPRRAPEVAS